MTTGGVSRRRADTRRNHERILAAALVELTESGDVSFNAIAKRA
ncbi:TetR/AcrR family transcriptional regulator, partial [Kibdelosporangium lantanae]